MRALFPELGGNNYEPMDVNPSAPLAQGLVAHIPLNEGSGKVLKSVGGEFVGTLLSSGTPLDNIVGSYWVPGRTGWCLQNAAGRGAGFANTNGIAAVSYPRMDLTPDLSCGIWCKPDVIAGGAYYTLFSKRVFSGTPINYEISLNNADGVIGFYNGTFYTSAIPPVVGAWNFIMATVQGSRLRLYLNGKRIYETTINVCTITTAGSLAIGWNNNNSTPNNFVGQMEHFYLYHRALFDGEVAELYANPWAPEKATNKRAWMMSGSGVAPPASSTPVFYMHRTVQGMS